MGVMPYGAKPILEARKQGRRPKDMILISLIGRLENEINPVVIAEKDIAYDWAWIRGLAACFWTTPNGYVARHIKDCAKAAPSAIYLWDCANEKGFDVHLLPTAESIERPREQWEVQVDALRWLPFQEKAFAMGELQWN